jgi:hypothetical protein
MPQRLSATRSKKPTPLRKAKKLAKPTITCRQTVNGILPHCAHLLFAVVFELGYEGVEVFGGAVVAGARGRRCRRVARRILKRHWHCRGQNNKVKEWAAECTANLKRTDT